MGRELVVQLAAGGCDVATCDVHERTLAETVAAGYGRTVRRARRVTGHLCDVADEAQVGRFRDEVLAAHDRDNVNFLFNNAGVGGGYSFIAEVRGLGPDVCVLLGGGATTATACSSRSSSRATRDTS